MPPANLSCNYRVDRGVAARGHIGANRYTQTWTSIALGQAEDLVFAGDNPVGWWMAELPIRGGEADYNYLMSVIKLPAENRVFRVAFNFDIELVALTVSNFVLWVVTDYVAFVDVGKYSRVDRLGLRGCFKKLSPTS
jgi:hypothetical protein